MTTRSALADDRALLERMLVMAADWRPDSPPRPVDEVLAVPELARYVLGWPRPDDFGVIAENDEGPPVGAAWCRYFPADEPGYGFVSHRVPELSIGVIANLRGTGIGRQLMVSLIDEARNRSIAQISLSVELDNSAMRLYSRLGFTVAADADGSATMVLNVD